MEQDLVTRSAPAGPSGAPAGTARLQRRYLDTAGRYRTARDKVPVDEFGRLAGSPFRCRRCAEVRWMPAGRVKPGGPAPMCPVHERPMRPASLRGAQLLPWRMLWDVVERPLRPVWALPALVGAGVAVDAAPIPALAVAAGVPLVGEAARRVFRRERTAWHVRRGNLDAADPQAGKRRRAAIDRAARKVGYTAAGVTGWLAAVAGLGVDGAAGAVAWSLLLPAWLWPAASWWFMDRNRVASPPVVAEPTLEPTAEGPKVDPAEAEARRVWRTVLAYRQGDMLGRDAAGEPVRSKRDARLAGTRLEDWHTVSGGWAATIVGPIGAYESDQFVKAVGAIASAFSVKKSMVTVIPDPDDENRSTVMIQRTSPITGVVRWAGPDSIDVKRGVAPVAVYADGELCMYEMYRPGWGVPHVGAFSTTGGGKSELLNLLFTIDRWAQHEGRGLVADFLIDPQQGQSFGPFLDDLAGPVACSLPEAMLLVQALTNEALRRNRYLAREAKWWDERRKKWRTGGKKWWDPTVDGGPILALTIDEAHDYLSNRAFSTAVTKAGRMWRKCGMQIRIGTHTPLLADLGGSMALRDMLTGGFVWVGRTANSLSGPVAFNGRLPVDPRLIPAVPGMAYPLAGSSPKPMLARTMWEPDFLDWVRDDDDRPVGFPAVLPRETVEAFGRDYALWAANAMLQDEWRPSDLMRATMDHVVPALEAVEASKAGRPAAAEGPSQQVVDAVFEVLATAGAPLDMGALDADLRRLGFEESTLTVRAALKELRDAGLVVTDADRRHELTATGSEQAQAVRAEAA